MNLRGIVLGIAIFVLTLFVTIYGTDMIYSSPQYEDFCGVSNWGVLKINESVCFENGGKWNPTNAPKGEINGYCDRDFSCREAYDLSQERYSMNIFLVAVPLGILILLFGAYFFRLDPVGIGIMVGGVGTILRGVGSYWRYSEDWIRFLISLAGLLVLIYFSYKYSDKLGLSKRK